VGFLGGVVMFFVLCLVVGGGGADFVVAVLEDACGFWYIVD